MSSSVTKPISNPQKTDEKHILLDKDIKNSLIKNYAEALEGTFKAWVETGVVPRNLVPEIKNYLIQKWDAE